MTYQVCDNGVMRAATLEEAAEFDALAAAAQANALPNAKSAQCTLLLAAYENAVAQPVGYTSTGGVAKTYQSDPQSLGKIRDALLGYLANTTTPAGFYWVAADNAQVPFTYADLSALAAVMMAQGWNAFQHLQNLKTAISAATTVEAVQAITW